MHVTKASVENNFSTSSFGHWFDDTDIPDIRQKIRRLVDSSRWNTSNSLRRQDEFDGEEIEEERVEEERVGLRAEGRRQPRGQRRRLVGRQLKYGASPSRPKRSKAEERKEILHFSFHPPSKNLI